MKGELNIARSRGSWFARKFVLYPKISNTSTYLKSATREQTQFLLIGMKLYFVKF